VDSLFDENSAFLNKLAFGGIEENQKEPVGEDWSTLVRRFDCFMAPAYTKKVIEAGIERLDIIKAPFNRKGIARINENMEKRAVDRQAMARQWDDALIGDFEPKVNVVDELPQFELPLSFTLGNLLPVAILGAASALLAYITFAFFNTARAVGDWTLSLTGLVLVVVFAVLTIRGAVKLSHLVSPRKVVETLGRAVADALKTTEKIKSRGARVRTTVSPLDMAIQFTLVDATVHEQNLFAGAMEEMLSPIQSPKYVLIKHSSIVPFANRLTYWHSYSCPAILSDRKEDAAALQKSLRRLIGPFELVYTYNASGRDRLWKCCRFSYVNKNGELRRKHIAG
jgi:hypothetical protein